MSPVLRRLEVKRQTATNSAQPSGNAPKLARMLVIASGEPSVMSEAAAASTGFPMNLRLIKASTVSANTNTTRLIHGMIRSDIVIAPADEWLRAARRNAAYLAKAPHAGARRVARPTARC